MAICCGTIHTQDGTFNCPDKPVAAYTWEGVPFLYNGKPGAAVCHEHEGQLLRDANKYPGLTMVEQIKRQHEHAFERSGLGKAPFKFIGCEERRGPIKHYDDKTGVTTEIGSPGQPMGSCAHCGMGIAICCEIESADGKRFIVGNVCVNKTGDSGLVKKTRKAINARLAAKRQEQAVARKAWIEANLERAKPALNRKVHPNGYAGKTAYDWAVWMTKNAGDAGRRTVEKAIKAALGDAK